MENLVRGDERHPMRCPFPYGVWYGEKETVGLRLMGVPGAGESG